MIDWHLVTAPILIGLALLAGALVVLTYLHVTYERRAAMRRVRQPYVRVRPPIQPRPLADIRRAGFGGIPDDEDTL